jgi:hypothetical protein
MSALETTVRVSPEKQTLILAGEAIPRRNFDTLANRPLTIVATPADETPLLIQGSGETEGFALTPLSRNFTPPASPANAYLRTQALSSLDRRTRLVDTYA